MKIRHTYNERYEETSSQPLQEMTVHDLTELFIRYQEEPRNVFMHQIENKVYNNRTLGRND